MFIVLEGIDGAGGETQGKLLKDFLESKGKEVLQLSYPDPTGPIGKLIYGFLNREYDLPADVQFSLYATDFMKDRDRIKQFLSEEKFVITDRYIFSTLCYQTTKGFSAERGLKLAEIFELVKPDLVILQDISTETSVKRKHGEKKSLDRYEEDKEFLSKVRERYLKLAKDGVYAKEWVVIDGEQSIEKVAEEIKKLVLERMGS